jgi:hypothetical protein
MITMVASNPFPGLHPFEANQADLFFGRDEQIEELLDRLDRMRFVAVLGTSGSGKSSLVRAGLIPAILRGYFGGENWRTTVVRPGRDPIGELAVTLSEAFHLSRSDILSTLRRSSLGLVEFARAHLQPGYSLLIVIDQFEELIRYRAEAAERGGREESAAFVKLLLAATGHSELPASQSGDLPIYVVLTIRSEFLGKCSQFRGLPEALNNSQYLVPRMTREQLREAIEGPIGMAGKRIAPQLIQELLNDVGDSPDQLPVLQHALMRMWEQSSDAREQGEPIDLSHYESVGRMERALNLDADRAFGELGGDPHREAIARRLFQLLVEPGADVEETRRPSLLSEIVAVTAAEDSKVRQVIDVFHRNGFITLSEDDDPMVDVSHESLIRLWDRLSAWVKEESDSAETYIRLADSATKGMAFYRDPELTQALLWKERESPNAAWAKRYSRRGSNAFYQAMDFLERSRRTRERNQWMRRAVFLGLCLLSVVLGVLAFVAWKNANAATESARLAQISAVEADKERGEAVKQRAKAVKERQQAIVEKNRADEQWKAAEKARKEADRSKSAAASAQREASARRLAAEAVTLRGGGASKLEVSTLLAIESEQRSPQFENDFVLRESLRLLPGKVLSGTPIEEKVWQRTAVTDPDSLTLSPDGRYLVIDGGLFDLANGTEVLWRSGDHSHIVGKSGFSPDGRYVAIRSWQNLINFTVHLLDLANHSEKDVLPNNSGGPEDLSSAVEQPGLLAVAVSQDGRVAAGYRPVAYSADGRYVVLAVSNDPYLLPTPLLMEATTGKQISRLIHARSMVNALVFSPDSRFVASANGDGLTLFEASSGREFSHVPYEVPLTTVAYSQDGRLLATAASNTVGIFEVATMNEIVRLTLDDIVHSIAFIRDGRALRTASGSRNIRVQEYPIFPTDLITDACSRVSRNLTHEEWQRYVGKEPYQQTCPNLP